MTIKYKGYCKNGDSLPVSPLPTNAVQFDEPDDFSDLNSTAVLYCIPIMLVIALFLAIKKSMLNETIPILPTSILGLAASFLVMIPHELLHAIVFPREAEVHLYLMRMGAFVTSECPVSKQRFIIISLLPFLILGIVPMAVWLFLPQSAPTCNALYIFGVLNLLSCCGDIMNLKNALLQMPKNAYQICSGFHSYWYTADDD